MNKNTKISVAIVSDTHGYLSKDVAEVVARCDMVIHAGDVCGKNVLDCLHASSNQVVAVRGNNDLPHLWDSNESDAVNSLPRVAELQLPGGILAVEHGHEHGFHTPDHEKLRQAHPQARVVIYGHTHKRVIDRSQTPWVVNPGAAGKIRNNGGPSCLVLHASLDGWEFESFQFPEQSAPAKAMNQVA